MSKIGRPIREIFVPRQKPSRQPVITPDSDDGNKVKCEPEESPIYVPNWPVRIEREIENE